MRRLSGETNDFLKIVLPACRSGDLRAVTDILEDPRGFVRWTGPHGRTMVWEAARSGRTEIVKLLAETHDADCHALGCYFRETRMEVSPWLVATLRGHEETADYLDSRGAGCDLLAACYLGDRKRVDALLAEDPAAANRPVSREHPWNPYRAWPLQYAIAGKQPDMVRRLLDAGANAAVDPCILFDAVATEQPAVADMLLSAGGDPVASGHRDWIEDPTLRSLALARGHRLAETDFPPEDWPELVDACRGNHNAPDDPDRVRPLLERGDDVAIRDYKGKTALHRAAQAGFVAVTELLMAHGAEIDARDAAGETPLFDAAFHGRIAVLTLLATAGAELEARNQRGETPLFAAVRGAKPEAVTALKDLGAAMDAQNDKGKTPAQIAAKSRKKGIEAVRPLLAA